MRKDSEVVLVEDNPIDAMAVRRAFRAAGLSADLRVCPTAEDALDYLTVSETVRVIVIIDIRLPGMSGLDLVAKLRETPTRASYVSYVLTSSTLDEDVRAAYEQNVAGYFVKTAGGESLVELGEILVRLFQRNVFPCPRTMDQAAE